MAYTILSIAILSVFQAVYGTLSKYTAEQLALQASRQHAENLAAAAAPVMPVAPTPVDSGEKGLCWDIQKPFLILRILIQGLRFLDFLSGLFNSSYWLTLQTHRSCCK